MSFLIEKKQVWITFVFLGLILSFITGIYFWKIDPLKSEVALMKKELKAEQERMTTILELSTSVKDINLETTVELQKILPVKPLVQQLLLDLEKAEVVSNSIIKNMSINEEQEVSMGSRTETSSKNAQDQLQEEMNQDIDENEETKQQQYIDTDLPNALKKVTVTMNVESPTYVELEKFLSSLESMKRIITIESLSFTGEEELTSIEQTTEPLHYSVGIAAYYAPVLEDLRDDLPSMETEEPGKKRNPFYSSPNSSTIEAN